MAVNKYFNNFPSEKRMTGEALLMESVVDESIQIMGHNIYYIPRESVDNADLIFGESTKVRFEHAYMIEAYLANVEGFEGDTDFFSKFGLEIRNNTNLVISRRGFARIMPTSLRGRPQEGDILWIPLLHRMFEIKFVEKNLMYYSLGNRMPYVYELRCEEFRYSEELIDTGVDEIDDVEKENTYTVMLNLTGGSGNFSPDEMVFQGPNGNSSFATVTANVNTWFAGNNTLFVHNVSGSFEPNTYIYGATTLSRYTIVSEDLDKGNITHDLSDNEEFATDTTLILDLSEINPFGSP